jgi:hypothetical protein
MERFFPIEVQLNRMSLGSSSQRNTFAKFLRWGKILQCLPRALVEVQDFGVASDRTRAPFRNGFVARKRD